MKRKMNQIKTALILGFVVACFSFNFGVPATAQDTKRQRVIEKPSPTPPASPVTLTPTPTPSPTPAMSVQTLAELQSRIQLALSRNVMLQRGQIGVKIVSLDTDKVIYEQMAEKYFMPASNMKSYTVATAMEKLSPDFRFITNVYSSTTPDSNGTIRGNLSVLGRGDVSISMAFNDGDIYKGLDALAQKIVQAGVKRIEGDLIGDESYFSGSSIPAGWEWDDLQGNSGAEISALALNNNVIRLTVKPGSANSPCSVQMQPANSVYKVINQCQTSDAMTKSDLKITKKLEQNILEISGTLPPNDKGFDGAVTVSHTAELFIAILRQLLEQKGVVITGQNRIIGAKEKSLPAAAGTVPPVEITRLESPPFSVVAAQTMKPSQNMYAETILWTLGEQGRGFSPLTEPNPYLNPKSTSAEKGVFVVKNFLKEIGISPDSVIQWDGSGLSRHNLITPNSAVQLYTYMAKQSRYAQVWRDSLTIGGVDGTLQNRFKGTPAAGNVRGKTGTIDQVSALSGYVSTAAGERLVFSILVNGVPDGRLRQATIDEIIVALANFNGRTN